VVAAVVSDAPSVSSRLWWPLFWLLGFRVHREDNMAWVTIPHWIPAKMRQAIIAGITEKVKWQKFDTKIR
jgi:hypothetical protein